MYCGYGLGQWEEALHSNASWRYVVTPPLFGWAQPQNDPCCVITSICTKDGMNYFAYWDKTTGRATTEKYFYQEMYKLNILADEQGLYIISQLTTCHDLPDKSL